MTMRVPAAHLLTYATAAVIAAAGVALLLGGVAGATPRPLRLTLGVVLVLLALYRVVITRLHAREGLQADED